MASPYTQRPQVAVLVEDCRDFLRTGRCKYGASCKFNHPANVQTGGGMKVPRDPSEPLFPIRPNEPVCQYYMKHGTCKFGQACKFHHPPHSSLSASTLAGSSAMYISRSSESGSLPQHIMLNASGQEQVSSTMMLQFLPQRPDEPDCLYFLRHGSCKYGATCRYHHPVNHQQRKSDTQRRTQQQQVMQLPAHVASDGSLQFVQTQQAYPPNSRVVSTSGGQHMLITETPIHVMSVNKGGFQNGEVNDYCSGGLQTSTGLGGLSQDHASSSSSIASSYETANSSSLEYMNQGQSSWSRPKRSYSGGSLQAFGEAQQARQPSLHAFERSFSGGSLQAFGEAQQMRHQQVHTSKRVVSDNSISTRQQDNRRLRTASFGSVGSTSENSASYHDGVVGWSSGNGQLPVHQERDSEGVYFYEQALRQHHRIDGFDSRQGSLSDFPHEGQRRGVIQPGPVRQRPSGDYVDHGLSMMTSALLNMLDTPEEAAAKSYPSRISSSSTLNNNSSPSMTPRSGNIQAPQYLVPVLNEHMMPSSARNLYSPDFRSQMMYKPIDHPFGEISKSSAGDFVSSKQYDQIYNTGVGSYQHGDPRSVSSQWSPTWQSSQPVSRNNQEQNSLLNSTGPPSPENNVGLFLS